MVLDPGVTFLNHGLRGDAEAVLDRQDVLRTELEREPVAFLWRRLPELVAESARTGRRRSSARTQTDWRSCRTRRRV